MNTRIEKIAAQLIKLRFALQDESMKGNHNLMQQIKECEMAKRAIEIAAVHGNSIGFFGGDNAHKLVILAGQFIVPALADKNCPCGNYGSIHQACNCSIARIRHYQSSKKFAKVKNADLVVEVMENLPPTNRVGENFETVMARVQAARDFLVVHPSYKDTLDGQALWKLAIYDLGIQSGRLDVIRGIAQVIAALDRLDVVQPQHVAEALQYAAFASRTSLVLK